MSKGRILLVEDDRDLLRLVRYNFEKEGYRVVACADGEAALAAARKEKPDLVLLDVMLPKMDGLEVCRALRRESQVPIIFLTAKKSEMDRILGLKLGGDDYVTKPFSVGELLARVEALLRRASRSGEPAEESGVRVGELRVDFERHEVWVKGKPAALTPKEFEFLKMLIEAKGKVLSRDLLLERIWGYDKSMDIDTRTVDQHIARLRRKLKSEGHRIVTVTHVGYKIKL